jgi:hypothetical protein
MGKIIQAHAKQNTDFFLAFRGAGRGIYVYIIPCFSPSKHDFSALPEPLALSPP